MDGSPGEDRASVRHRGRTVSNDQDTDPMLPAVPGPVVEDPEPDVEDPEPPPDRPDVRRVLIGAGLLVLVLLLAWGGWQLARPGAGPTPLVATTDLPDPSGTASPPAAPSPPATPRDTTPSARSTPSPTPTPTSSPTTTPSPTPTPTPSATPTATPTPSATPTPAEPAPRVLGFEVTTLGNCPEVAGEEQYELTWASQDADAATLTDPDGTTTEVPTSGNTVRCAEPAPTPVFTLEVTGPGGSDRATASP